MRKVILNLAILAITLLTLSTPAQLILTQSVYQPVVGDIGNSTYFDSVSIIPKNTGLNQTWNFSAITQNTNSPTTQTCISLSSAPYSSMYPGANIVMAEADGTQYFFKSINTPTSQLEYLGFKASYGAFSYTNTYIAEMWPFTFGNSYTDSFSGTFSGNTSGTTNGISIKTGTGTGTLILPGGVTLSNVLQIMRTETTVTTSNLVQGPTSATTTSKIYMYMHASKKSPVLTLSYFRLKSEEDSTDFQGFYLSKSSDLPVGLTENISDISLSLFPNPSEGSFSVVLHKETDETSILLIYDLTSKLIRYIDLGNDRIIKKDINLPDLEKGIYTAKVVTGNKTSFKKLILE